MTPEQPVTRLLVIGHHAGDARAVADLVEAAAGLGLLAVAATAEEAREACAVRAPDAVLVDVDGGDEAVLLRAVADCVPDTTILALAGTLSRARLTAVLAGGGRGVLLKGGDAAELAATVAGALLAPADTTAPLLVQPPADDAGAAPLRASLAVLEVELAPIVDLRTGQVVGADVLPRPADGEPDELRADAAAAGLTAELERATLQRALARLGELPPGSFACIRTAPETLLDGALLQGVPRDVAERIVVELGGGGPAPAIGLLLAALEEVRATGARVAIGTTAGPSLQDVLRLDPHLLKLDRALVEPLEHAPEERAAVDAVVAFARATDATVVAEGVETAGQLAALRAAGVQLGRGPLLDRPELAGAGTFDDGAELPEPGAGVALVEDADARTSVLRAAPRAPTADDAAAGRWRSASDAVQGALAYLEQQVPEAVVWVAHLDYSGRRWQVLDARRGEARGVEAGTTAVLDESACYHVAAARTPGLVADAEHVEELAELELVALLGVRSLACAPVTLRSGVRIAGVGAATPAPHALGPSAERAVGAAAMVLSDAFGLLFADRPLDEVAERLRAVAATDWLTGVPNRQRLLTALKREWRRARRSALPSAVVTVDVAGLGALTQNAGHARAELLLRTMARRITQSLGPGDVAGRTGEASFAVVLPGHDDRFAQRFAERLETRLETGLGAAAGELSIDAVWHDLGSAEDPVAVLRRAPATGTRHTLVTSRA